MLAAVLGAERDPRRWPGQLARRAGGDLDPRRGCRIPAPALTSAARMTEPDLVIASRDGTPIAVFTIRRRTRRSSSSTARPATTRRSVSSARCSATWRTVQAMDRRGAGRLGRHAALRDRARVRGRGRGRRRAGRRAPAAPVDVVGHSYGGRSRARGRAADRCDRPGRSLRGRTRRPPARATTRRASRRACASGSRPAIGTAPSRRS